MGIELFKHLGTIWGQGQPKFWGFIGAYPRKTPNFGDGDGVTTLRMFGDTLGMGKLQILGFFEGKSPNFGVGTGEEISGIFPTLIVTLLNR